jgi:hypothetical protein
LGGIRSEVLWHGVKRYSAAVKRISKQTLQKQNRPRFLGADWLKLELASRVDYFFFFGAAFFFAAAFFLVAFFIE